MATDDEPTENTRLQRWIDRTQRPLDILALVFLLDVLLIWSFPNASGAGAAVLNAISWLVWGAFAVDYLVRLALSPDKGRFVRSHKLDLLMVLVPMLRLLRVALLIRRSLSSLSTEKIASSMVSIAVVIVLGAAWLEWRVEYDAPGATITTFREAVWWAVVTTTTVGYGDYTPVTQAGRLIGMVVMLVGVGLIGTVSATVAAWFVDRKPSRQGTTGADDELEAQVDAGSDADEARTLIGRLDALAADQAEIRRMLQRLSPPQ